MNKIIDVLVKQGKLKKKTVGLIQVEELLRQAILDLEEAKKTLNVAVRATYLLAYMAMLKAGKALLYFRGYMPDDGAQHRTIVEVTSAVLGKEYKILTEHFEIMRRKRHKMTYEAGALISKSESRKALTDAIGLVNSILVKVKKTSPQLELELDLGDLSSNID